MVTRIPSRAARRYARPAADHPAPAPPPATPALAVPRKNMRRAATGMLGLSGERMSKVDTAWLRVVRAAT